MKQVFEKPAIVRIELDEDIITTSTTLCQPNDTGFVPDP